MAQPLRHYHVKGKLTVCGLVIRPEGTLEDVVEIAPFWQGVTCLGCCEKMEHDIDSNEHRAECRACRDEWKKQP